MKNKILLKALLTGCLLMLATGLLSGCSSRTSPIVTGAWKDLQSPLQSLSTLDVTSKSLKPIVQDVPKITFARTAMFHNFSLPVSADGKWIAYFQQDEEGTYTIEIHPTDNSSAMKVISLPIGQSIARSREGFSGNSKYFAFTVQDVATKKQSVQIVNLEKQTSDEPLENAYFLDFNATSEKLYALELDDANKVTGIIRVKLSDHSKEVLYQPAENEDISFAVFSPDEKWIITFDYNSKSLFRIPLTGGASTLIYQYSGSAPSANYDPYGNYLVVIDSTSDTTTVKLFNRNFSNIYTLTGLGSSEMSFSKNGLFLAYQLYGANAMDFYVTDFNAGTYHLQANSGQLYRSDISPDQSYLVYVAYDYFKDIQGDLYTAPLTTLTPTKIASNVTSFSFSPSGKLIFTTIDKANNQSSIYQNTLGKSENTLLVGPIEGVTTIIN